MRQIRFSELSLFAGLGVGMAFTPVGTAFAQQLDEIIVTAQKREQSLEDVGISVTALTGAEIKSFNFRSLVDIQQQTPNLAVAEPLGASGNQNFTLRGVGLNDFSEHNESPVATYQDGVYLATIAGINSSIFDVNRIEVLRGPQGTLYGRNTTGGLVQFISNKPSAEPEGYAEYQAGSFSENRFEGAFGGPLTDTLRARVSLLYDNHDGYRPDVYHGDGTALSPLSVKAADAADLLAGRVQLEYVGADGLQILLSAHALTNHTTGPSYHQVSTMYAPNGITQLETPPNVVNPTCAGVFGATGPGQDCFGYRNTNPNWQVTNTNRQPIEDLDTNGTSLTVTDKFGGLDFTSITAYEHVHKFYAEDTDAGPYPAIAVTNPLQSKEMTQEFRLAGKTDRTYWTTGLYYFYRDINTGSDTDVSGLGFVNDSFHDELISRSAAAFGQLEYSLSHDFTLIGGLRYSNDDQNFRILSSDLSGLTPQILGITPAPVPNYNVFPFTGGATTNSTAYTNTRTDNLVTFRAELDWKPVEGLLTYASVSKGTKSAGWNAAIDGSGLLGASTPQTLPYAPEKLLAYELGFKDNIQKYLRLNGALFYYDYKDFQAFTFQGLTQQISNLPATVKGAELELVTSPTSNWDLTLGAGALDSAVKGVTVAVAGVKPLETVVLPDREMVLAPKYELNGSLRYHFPVAADKELGFQVDTRYVAKEYFDLTNDPIATEGGHAVSNASTTLTGADGRWTVSFWVKNMFARQYATYVIPVTSLGFSQLMVGDPRWFGGTIRYRW